MKFIVPTIVPIISINRNNPIINFIIVTVRITLIPSIFSMNFFIFNAFQLLEIRFQI